MGNGKAEIERGALVQFGMCPDTASMLLDNPLHNREAHSGSLKVLLSMETLKDTEQLAAYSMLKPAP